MRQWLVEVGICSLWEVGVWEFRYKVERFFFSVQGGNLGAGAMQCQKGEH